MSIYALMLDDGPLGEAFRGGRQNSLDVNGAVSGYANPHEEGTEEWTAWNLGWNTTPVEEAA